MKKFFVLFLTILLFTTCCSYAKSKKNVMPSVKMNGKTFSLYYSAKSSETNGYLNEYYKKYEGYTIWTELIGLHHYPNAFYPAEHAQEFKIFLEEAGIPNELEVDNKNNTAILDFVVINDKKLPIVMEFNVFKYVKSPVCGTIGLQYAKRYLINNALEVNKAKKEFKKTRRKYIKRVKKLKVPELITTEIEKGVYLNPPKDETSASKSEKEKTKKEKTKSETIKEETSIEAPTAPAEVNEEKSQKPSEEVETESKNTDETSVEIEEKKDSTVEKPSVSEGSEEEKAENPPSD